MKNTIKEFKLIVNNLVFKKIGTYHTEYNDRYQLGLIMLYNKDSKIMTFNLTRLRQINNDINVTYYNRFDIDEKKLLIFLEKHLLIKISKIDII